MNKYASKILPAAALLAGIAAFWYFGLGQYVSFDALAQHHEALTAFVADNQLLAAAGYAGLYAVATAFSLPVGTILTVGGGFLFGSILGTGLVVIGATVGAVAIFLAARTALADLLRGKAGGLTEKMRAGFAENALSYMLVLRLIPLFPFFVVNIVPGLLGVQLRVFAIGTLIGIIPGTFVYSQVGTGLGSILASGDELSLAGVLTPEIITALVGLGVLSLLPVAYKKYKRRAAAS